MGRAGELSDAELLHGSARDPEAFVRFYDRYERVVVAFLMRRTRDPELTADLTAEVFARVLGAAGRYRGEGDSAAGWVLAIAHNTLAKSVRRGRVESAARRRLGIREALVIDDDALDQIEAIDVGDGSLRALLAALPEGQRRAIELRVLEDRSYAEAAVELNTSELVVRKRVSRGLSRLRHAIEENT